MVNLFCCCFPCFGKKKNEEKEREPLLGKKDDLKRKNSFDQGNENDGTQVLFNRSDVKTKESNENEEETMKESVQPEEVAIKEKIEDVEKQEKNNEDNLQTNNTEEESEESEPEIEEEEEEETNFDILDEVYLAVDDKIKDMTNERIREINELKKKRKILPGTHHSTKSAIITQFNPPLKKKKGRTSMDHLNLETKREIDSIETDIDVNRDSDSDDETMMGVSPGNKLLFSRKPIE